MLLFIHLEGHSWVHFVVHLWYPHVHQYTDLLTYWWPMPALLLRAMWIFLHACTLWLLNKIELYIRVIVVWNLCSYGVLGRERYHTYAGINDTTAKTPLTMTVWLQKFEDNVIMSSNWMLWCKHTKSSTPISHHQLYCKKNYLGILCQSEYKRHNIDYWKFTSSKD